MLGEKKSINFSKWPEWDEAILKDDEIKIAVQVNGKVRAEIMVGVSESEESVKTKALQNESILKFTTGKNINRVIYVKNRLVNIVV
jgi:leucyl-tRNA synthetase